MNRKARVAGQGAAASRACGVASSGLCLGQAVDFAYATITLGPQAWLSVAGYGTSSSTL